MLHKHVCSHLHDFVHCRIPALNNTLLNHSKLFSTRSFPTLLHTRHMRFISMQSIKQTPTHCIQFKRYQSTVSVSQLSSNTQSPFQSHYAIPSSNNRQIGRWLIIVSGVIFVMVTLGGVTRLTRSGLSMTEWKLHDIRPPLNDSEWMNEFDKYKVTPEYIQCNRDMTLSEFKRIYLYEYSHRVLGRAIGVLFGVPLIYFIARGKVHGKLGIYLSGIFILGGMQGAVGWWMVKSGLADWGYQKQSGVNQTPRVSPYRLATHLLSAFTLYVLVLKTALNCSYPVNNNVTQIIPNRLKYAVFGVTGIIFVTVFSGAFVAGNQAGLIYNEFPYMGNTLIPYDDLWIHDIVPQWRNWFENSTLVQFDHRVLAMTTLASVITLWVYSRRFALPHITRVWLNTLLGVTGAQVALGITTLINHVPVSLGSAHQFTALALLSTIIIARHSMGALSTGKPIDHTTSNVQSVMQPNIVPLHTSQSTSNTVHSNNQRLLHTARHYNNPRMMSTDTPSHHLSTNITQSLSHQSSSQHPSTTHSTHTNNDHNKTGSLNGPTFAVIVFSLLLTYKTMFAPSKVEQELARSAYRDKASKSTVPFKSAQ